MLTQQLTHAYIVPVQLSSLIIRLSPNGFPHPFLTLLTLLTPAPSSSSPPSLALPLEFFKITVEEVSRTGLIGQRKIQIHEVLEQGSQVAVGSCLGVLKRWLEDGGGDKGREREDELTAATSCLEVWIGWGLSGESVSSIGQSRLFSEVLIRCPDAVSLLHHSLPLLIGLLAHPDSFVQASDCLQQVLTDSVLRDGRGSKVLTEPILAWLPSIASQIDESCFQSQSIRPLAHCRLGLTRLFVCCRSWRRGRDGPVAVQAAARSRRTLGRLSRSPSRPTTSADLLHPRARLLLAARLLRRGRRRLRGQLSACISVQTDMLTSSHPRVLASVCR
jgi:hypothetical protein